MAGHTARAIRPPTILETALQYDRLSLIVLLVVLPLVAWIWLVVLARDMHGPMTGASDWIMTPTWDGRSLALIWVMWALMMVGMMLPSATPKLLQYGGLLRRSATGPVSVAQQIYAVAAGYLAVWVLFSVGATLLQWLLAEQLFISPMMVVTSPPTGATLLLIAGLYQLTPLKRACLTTCQSPLPVLTSQWGTGKAGAFRTGLAHGATCVGCCWALMLLLFVGGVMNLVVIAALTVFIAFEKLASFGTQSALVSGVLLIVAGLWMLVR